MITLNGQWCGGCFNIQPLASFNLNVMQPLAKRWDWLANKTWIIPLPPANAYPECIGVISEGMMGKALEKEGETGNESDTETTRWDKDNKLLF